MSHLRAHAHAVDPVADGSRVALPASRPRRKRLGVDARRAELIELGFELFRTHAYDALSVEQIAIHAQISKGLLYHYFQSKCEYYLQVVRALADEFVLMARTQIRLSSMETLEAGVDELLDHARSRRGLIDGLTRGAFGTADEVSKIVELTRREIVANLMADLDERAPGVRNALRGWVQFAERTVLAWIDHEEVGKAELRRLLIATAAHAIHSAQSAAAAHGAGNLPRRELHASARPALTRLAGSA
jgi:AcrR family transcriptional regulator